ncbi:protein disulfide isomerase-like 1-5 [Phalaenopsis equestris]|uniref:protein disulfide isomerase-like 1-5 n=1 Tax=Phalaenopsis equestris TaxID=78828 RepID=UPI0009E2C971|nr:protein disulfide isomerase-like 1-5 [Phalaenopsis equestris]
MAIGSRKVASLLVLSFFLYSISSVSLADVDKDLEDIEELLSIDEEEDMGSVSHGKPSAAELLSRAQRIVVELNNENVKRVIDGNELVLVLGYAPWCQRSSELMPRFAKAATALNAMGSSVVMAKLDAERYTKAAKLLEIKGFPTILLFVNGSGKPYTGGFSRDEIFIWVRKKTGFPVIRLSSVTAAEEFLKRHQILVIGFFDSYEGIEYNEFVKAAASENEIQFVETNDVIVAKVLYPNIRSSKPFIGIVKGEPERFESFEEEIEEGNILNFIEVKKFALLTSLTELNSARVYSSRIKLQVYFFAEPDDCKSFLFLFHDVARKYNSKIMFIYVDSTKESLAKPLLTLFGLEAKRPLVTAFDNRIGSKYLMESDISPGNLEEFCSGLLHGALSPFFKSEPISNYNEMIEKIVGRTFDSSILESAENVFLEVYTPWCIDCEATSRKIEKLAKHFKGQENLKFARIDASLNEHPKLQIDNYPALLFYPAGSKSNPIKLSKKSSTKELAAFIKENMKSTDGNISSQSNLKKDEL